MSDLTLDVGLAAKLKVAFARNGWTEALIDKACEGDKLGQFKQVLLGHATITTIDHVIDCDADPFNPWTNDGFTVEEHQKSGQWKFDPKQVEFFLSKGQKGGKVIEGNKLREELKKKRVMNANVLDYLLKNPHLIPEDWKFDEQGRTRYIFFWGTVYRHRAGYLCVRCLFWGGSRWLWSRIWLVSGWRGGHPAAVCAS